MATIQVATCQTTPRLPAAGRTGGMSLQEYLRAELTRNLRTRTTAELVAEAEPRLVSEGSEGFATRSLAALLRADRAAP